jgi:hypothetical protein
LTLGSDTDLKLHHSSSAKPEQPEDAINKALTIVKVQPSAVRRADGNAFCRRCRMSGVKVFLRILLSLSVFVAGFSHAMPVDLSGKLGAGSATHPHCDEHAAQAMHGMTHDGTHASSRPATDKHQQTGCCKAGSCPCPHVAAVLWDGAVAIGSIGRYTSDFAPLRNDYRSPALERLIRPPIA